MIPDNAIYYHIAYTAAALVYGGYVISLIVRKRRARDREARQSATGVAQDR